MTDRLAELRQVNDAVNAIPFDLIGPPGEPYDLWKDAPDGGSFVCRDYTQAKATRLREMGWPLEALTVIECFDEMGEYHAVLAVDLDGVTWILDNRQPMIYPMDAPPVPYRWDRRQVPGTLDFVRLA